MNVRGGGGTVAERKEALLLNSGGLDSCVAAFLMKREGRRTVSLFLGLDEENREYGRAAAAKTAALYCDDHIEVEVPGIHPVTTKGYYHIPMRGKLIWVYGIAKAWELKIPDVVSGMKSDSNSDDAVEKFNAMVNCLKFPRPEILPQIKNVLFGYETMKEVLELTPGIEVGHTVSCNRHPPCGECYKCRERIGLGLEEDR